MLRTTCVLMILICSSAGCSDSGPPIAPVEGTVTFNGQPVQYAIVTFFPQNVPNAATGFTQTDADGKFSKVTTTGASRAGAVVGQHFVTVTEGWPPDKEVPVDKMGMQKSPPKGPWAQKYRDSTNPALKVEVIAGETNHFEFELSK